MMILRVMLVLVTGGVMTTTLLLLLFPGESPFCTFRFADAKVGSDDVGFSGGMSGCGGWQMGDDEDCLRASDEIPSLSSVDPTLIPAILDSASILNRNTGNATAAAARRRMERDGKRRKGKQRGRSRSQGGTTRVPDESPYLDLLRLSDFCPESFPVIRLNFVKTLINCMTSSKSFVLDTSTVNLPLTSVATWMTFNYTAVQLESSTFHWDHRQRTSFSTDEGTTSGTGTRTEGDNCSTSASCETFDESTGNASPDETEESSSISSDDDVYVEYGDENLIATELEGNSTTTGSLVASKGTSELGSVTSEHASSTTKQNLRIRNNNSPQEWLYVTEKLGPVLGEDSTSPKSSVVSISSSNARGTSSPIATHTPLQSERNNIPESSAPRNPDSSSVALNTYNVTPRPPRTTTLTKHPAVPRSIATAPTSSSSSKDPLSTPSERRVSARVSRQPFFTKPILLEHIPHLAETEDDRNMVRKHQQQLRVLSVGLIIGIIAAILLLAVLLVLAAYTARVLMRRFRRRPKPSQANAETNTTLTKGPVANGPAAGSGHPGEDTAFVAKTADQSEKAKPRDVVEWYV